MKDILTIGSLQSPVTGGKGPVAAGETGFGDFLRTAVDEVGKAQAEADRAVEKLHSGEARNLHEVMISMEQADISLRLAVQIRNKVIEAYQEIMRMQV